MAKMTLIEAIKHCEEKAKEQREIAKCYISTEYPRVRTQRRKCNKCAREHEQLAEWLKELKAYKERPQGEYEFIEILAQYVPDDICTYPEYKGKPYYSIHYKQNGEEFVGFGTYKPEVLSRYLKEYFMKGGAENGN